MTQSRRRMLGAAIGALPQLALLAMLILIIVTASDGTPHARAFGILLVLPELMIVPIALTIGLVCLSVPAANRFGRGIVDGTLISTAVFVPICVIASGS